LEGIDTPEIRTRDKEEKKYGNMAKEFVENKLPVGAKVTVMTKIDKEGKFGRMLGHIFCVNEKKWDISINSQLVYNNLAVRYNGQSKNDIKAAHRANWAALELKEI
jgi:micrococcal nuclease